MNGIDIAGHQKGINLAVVPCDFVIIKATQGTSFVNPEFTTQITQAIQLGKYVGVYHYASKGGYQAEAEHFLKTVEPYIGKAILVLDWEGDQNVNFGDPYYAVKWLDYVKSKTNITPFIYMSKSVCRQYKSVWNPEYPLWCAQYANKDVVNGYKTNPWTDTKGFGAWSDCKIYQYTGNGRLSGYNKALDLDLCYMSGDEWLKWAKGESNEVLDLDTFVIKPVLKKGDRNEYVRAWQMYLKGLGYDIGKAGCDGIFGNDTEKAVVKYQQDKGMESGIIGEQTWATLE